MMSQEPMISLESAQILDATGLRCPMPLLKAKLALHALPVGGVLCVWATDTASERDFRVFAELSGHQLLQQDCQAGVYRYWLRKA